MLPRSWVQELLLEKRHRLYSRLGVGREAGRATRYWASLRTYHEANDDDPCAIERSRFIADRLVPELGLTSLLEVGTNSGRNLGIIKQSHPTMRVRGIDVNKRALKHARRRYPDVEFAREDAHSWSEPDAWDGALTMSVLDHIPEPDVISVAQNMTTSARYVVCFEAWQGEKAEYGLYGYSRDTRRLFEGLGVKTLRWEMAPGQYDVERPMWLYVGQRTVVDE